MNQTRIEWATASWNPVTGCSPVSAGCDHCYAARMATRLRGRYGYPADDPFRVTLHPERLDEPLRWKKPQHIFVASMGDLFHDDVLFEYIAAVFGMMAATPQHTYMLLTKRPQRSLEFLEWISRVPATAIARAWQYALAYSGREDFIEWQGSRDWPLPNVWFGVTAEDQPAADERISRLLQTPAAKRFVSCEPLLGRIFLDGRNQVVDEVYYNFLKGETGPSCQHRAIRPSQTPALDWVIVGGETGPGARPMHPGWVRSLRNQCQAAGVPFFFKHHGEWAQRHDLQCVTRECAGKLWHTFDPDTSVCRVGKKAAGRLLDGREWNEYPE